MGELDGQVVLVTGSSRGIGREVARLSSHAGASVVVQYLSNAAAAASVLADLKGDDHMSVQADVSVAADVRSLVRKVLDRFGRIDVVVNNAGLYEPHPVLSTSFEDWQASWRRTIETNLIGPANLIHAVAPSMVEHGGGRIVNVTSRGAFRGEPDHAAYGASKAALNSLSQSMAQALAPHGIYVTAVAPGFVETDMAAAYLDGPEGDAIRSQSPMGRAATAEEVARVVVFLASPGADPTTGTIVDINGASYLRM
jgi:NAD(P)-dependent dehydrogenase (short-subunit alcohol dehydrogenase family)